MTQYRAKRLPEHRGAAAWREILGPAPPPKVLDGAIQADFAIIGAGFAGLTAARRLRQIDPSASIVVLEAGRLAEGASGRNSGFMIDLPHDLSSDDYAGQGDDRELIALNRQAIAFAARAVEEYEIDPSFFDRAGKINGAVSASAQRHNISYATHLEALGERFELLDRGQMREITGSPYYSSGLYTPGTVMLQPAGYIRGLAAGLRASGVEIFEESPVVAMARVGPSAWRLDTTRGAVSAGRVILTVNGHLESFGFASNRLMQIFLFATMTPELDASTRVQLGGQPRWGVTPSDPMGTTMRRIDPGQGGHRIVTRTCAVMRPRQRATRGDMTRAAAVMRKKFDQRFPQLAGMKMAYRWAGHLCLARNDVSVVGELADGLFAACVQNGLGTTRGTLTGIAAAEEACGIRSNISEYFEQQAEPSRLPMQPFAAWGANAYLKWRTWKARAE